MERDGWACRSCGKTTQDEPGIMFNVHHAYYEKGVDPWDYPSESMVTWCDACHESRHEESKKLASAIAQFDEYSYEGLLRIICRRGFRCLFFHLGLSSVVSEDEAIEFLQYMRSPERMLRKSQMEACDVR
jgi:hypothetical protein